MFPLVLGREMRCTLPTTMPDSASWISTGLSDGAITMAELKMQDSHPKLEQHLGQILLLVLLIGCLLVLRPFVSALLWAIVLCFSTWPVYHRLLKLVGDRPTLAALLMTLA